MGNNGITQKGEFIYLYVIVEYMSQTKVKQKPAHEGTKTHSTDKVFVVVYGSSNEVEGMVRHSTIVLEDEQALAKWLMFAKPQVLDIALLHREAIDEREKIWSAEEVDGWFNAFNDNSRTLHFILSCVPEGCSIWKRGARMYKLPAGFKDMAERYCTDHRNAWFRIDWHKGIMEFNSDFELLLDEFEVKEE